MIISFFEEFPTKENLDKIELITFPTRLYIATESIEELSKIKKQIKSKYIKEIIWWPILNEKEGYYFSVFSSKKAMKRILNQINNQKTMIDLEMPHQRKQMISKFYRIFTNKSILNKILKNKNTISCEHFIENNLMKLIGLNYKKQNKIKMIYTSHIKLPRTIIEKIIEKLAKKYSNLKIGLGLISHGVENIKLPVLAPQQLEEDLKLCKKHKIKEVIIFRLGGLNKKYVTIIKDILKS